MNIKEIEKKIKYIIQIRILFIQKNKKKKSINQITNNYIINFNT